MGLIRQLNLSNEYGDVNENNNRFSLALKQTLHVHHAFLYISLPLLHDYDVKKPNLTFPGGREHKTATFFFFSELRYSFYNSTPEENCQHSTEIEQDGISRRFRRRRRRRCLSSPLHNNTREKTAFVRHCPEKIHTIILAPTSRLIKRLSFYVSHVDSINHIKKQDHGQ